MILHILIAMVAGWVQRHQQHVITYLQEEHRVLKAQHGGRRLRLPDTERRRLAVLAYPLGRQRLTELAILATPDTLLRWYKRLMANKFDDSKQRKALGRPRVSEDVAQLVIRMAHENPTWGYRRIQGALANLGHGIDKMTMRNILRRHHMEPAPQRRQAGMSWTQFLKFHWDVLATTDFFTVEVATWHGLVTYYVLVVMELATRRVQVAGSCTPTLRTIPLAQKPGKMPLSHYALEGARLWSRIFFTTNSPASIMASATPFCFCTTQKHLSVKNSNYFNGLGHDLSNPFISLF
jgi:putative transposase